MINHQFPEIVEIEIREELDGFERTVLDRLLLSFSTIQKEGEAKRLEYLEEKSRTFNPDIDDEGCIEERAFFEEIGYICIENELRQEFLNSSAVWLYHLLERQHIRLRETYGDKDIKKKLYNNIKNTKKINELRKLVNGIKHRDDNISIKESDLRLYLDEIRYYWENKLYKKIIK